MSTVKQSQAIPFTGPYSLLVCHLRNLTGEASATLWCVYMQTLLAHSCSCFHWSATLASLISGDVEELDGTDKNTLKIFKNIILVHDVGMVLLEVSKAGWGPGPAVIIVSLCSIHSASALFLWPSFSLYSLSVDSQPSQWHVCWRCHYSSAGSPVKPKSSERLVLNVASAAANMDKSIML